MSKLVLKRRWFRQRTAITVGLLILCWCSLWIVSESLYRSSAPDKEFIYTSMRRLFSRIPEKKTVRLPSGKRVLNQTHEASPVLANDYRVLLLAKLSQSMPEDVFDGNYSTALSTFLNIHYVSSPEVVEGNSFRYVMVADLLTYKGRDTVINVEQFNRIVIARCKAQSIPCQGEIIDIRNWGI